MPPERSEQLVYDLEAWYRSHSVRQKDLAGSLGMSAQQLAEILSMRNRPTGEQALRMLEFLNAENMKTLIDPPAMPRPTARDPSEPRTLTSALEKIDLLQSRIKQLESAAATTGAPTAAKPTAKSVTSTAPTTKPVATSTAMEREIERARQSATAGLSSKPLAEQSVDELRAALNNAEPKKQAEIYQHLQQRKRDAKLSNPRARLGGA